MILPWRVFRFVNDRWPRVGHLLRFGTLNANTESHWDEAWARHGVDGFRATEALTSVRERLLREVPRGARVLDVGCGAGELLELLRAQRGCSGSGSDISPVAVARAREQRFEARVAALPEIPYPDEAFDLVVCTETMEHVTNVRASVREVTRVLRPGGCFILTVPDGTVDDEPVHVHRFTAATVRELLGRDLRVVGVEVIDDPNGRTLFAVAAKEPSELPTAGR